MSLFNTSTVGEPSRNCRSTGLVDLVRCLGSPSVEVLFQLVFDLFIEDKFRVFWCSNITDVELLLISNYSTVNIDPQGI